MDAACFDRLSRDCANTLLKHLAYTRFEKDDDLARVLTVVVNGPMKEVDKKTVADCLNAKSTSMLHSAPPPQRTQLQQHDFMANYLTEQDWFFLGSTADPTQKLCHMAARYVDWVASKFLSASLSVLLVPILQSFSVDSLWGWFGVYCTHLFIRGCPDPHFFGTGGAHGSSRAGRPQKQTGADCWRCSSILRAQFSDQVCVHRVVSPNRENGGKHHRFDDVHRAGAPWFQSVKCRNDFVVATNSHQNKIRPDSGVHTGSNI